MLIAVYKSGKVVHPETDASLRTDVFFHELADTSHHKFTTAQALCVTQFGLFGLYAPYVPENNKEHMRSPAVKTQREKERTGHEH